MNTHPSYGAQLVWIGQEIPPFPLHKIITTLGRNEANDIMLDDPKVSSFHCNILSREDGYYLLDMKSRNGTWVNGQQVTECHLKDSDILDFGDLKLRFAKRPVFSQGPLPLSRLSQKIQTMIISTPSLRGEAEEMMREVERQQNNLAFLIEILTSLAELGKPSTFVERLRQILVKFLDCKSLDVHSDRQGLLPDSKAIGDSPELTRLVYAKQGLDSNSVNMERIVQVMPEEDGANVLLALKGSEANDWVVFRAQGVNPMPKEESLETLQVISLFSLVLWKSLLQTERQYRAETQRLLNEKEQVNQEKIQRLEQRNRELGDLVTTREERLVYSEDSPMEKVIELVRKLSTVDLPILITGETGTGKTYLANSLHRHSPRAAHGFFVIDCATIPGNLIESELFGYEKGAFTGASGRKPGKVEMANGGTLFLDEIGDLPLELQGKLLRFVQEGRFERVGGTETLKVDVRLIAATNYDLEERVKQIKFRQDLFFRLNVLALHVPPLRERKTDITLLARHFIQKHFNDDKWSFTSDAQEAIQNYEWPGNVRELENRLQRAWIFHVDSRISAQDLGFQNKTPAVPGLDEVGELEPKTLDQYREEFEGAILAKCLRFYAGNITKCAEHLGISRNTCKSMIKKYHINVRDYVD